MFRTDKHYETDNGSGDRADDQGRQLVKILLQYSSFGPHA